jgi:polysaccharide export outer membrane protein
MSIFNRYFSLFLIIPVLFACNAAKKNQFFNDLTPSVQLMDSQRLASTSRVLPSDRLNIVVSSTEPSLTAYLNPFGTSSGTNNLVTGYLVSPEGQIEFPLLGKISVSGQTTTQIADSIKNKLSFFYKDLFVHVNLIGRVYVISGNEGSVITLQNERMTILEAMAQNTSKIENTKKKDVWVIREDSGRRVYAKINLTSKNLFQSPYFYLKSNDFIYLKPSISNWFMSNNSPFRFAITIVGTILGIIVLITRL